MQERKITLSEALDFLSGLEPENFDTYVDFFEKHANPDDAAEIERVLRGSWKVSKSELAENLEQLKEGET